MNDYYRGAIFLLTLNYQDLVSAQVWTCSLRKAMKGEHRVAIADQARGLQKY